MLGQEDSVRVICPAGAGSFHVIGPEMFLEATCPTGTTNVIHQAAHSAILATQASRSKLWFVEALP
jgi:hypothetical protein